MQKHLLKTIEEVKGGNKAAFSSLIEAFQHKAFGLAYKILGDEEEAKDVVQDSFIRMWEKIYTYNPNEKFTNWMYKIVSNRAIDRFRAVKRRPSVAFSDQVMARLQKETALNDTLLENKELGEMIILLTGELPVKQKLVFTLRDLQGLSSGEVKAVTGLSETHIKSNLHHARKSIRQKLITILGYENILR